MLNKLNRKKQVKKKIILIIPSLSSGGAERIISQMASYWSLNGIDVSIMEISPIRNARNFKLNRKVKVIRLFKENDFKLFIYLNTFLRLFLTLRRKKPINVISFLTPVNILSIVACKLLKIRCIVSERTDPSSYSYGFIFDLLRFFLYRFAYKVVVQTERNKNYLRSRVPGKYSVIPNFVNLKNFENNKTTKEKLIISIGRLSKEKRHNLTILAMSKIKYLIPGWNLLILGSGPEKQTLSKIIKQNKLSKRVFLKGNVKNVFKYLNKSSIGILTSSFEGFPNALLEKLAAGLPVIATKEAGYMILKNNYNGILLDREDPDTIGRKIYELTKNQKLQKTLSKNALKTVQKYKIKNIMNKWEEILI